MDDHIEYKLYKPRPDKFTEVRGGYSTLLSIACNKCRHEVLLYQKDGPGPLLRMYADRILAPDNLVKKTANITIQEEKNDLICPACNRVLAAAVIYEKEQRLAFRIFVGAIRKSVSDGLFPKKERKSSKVRRLKKPPRGEPVGGESVS